MDWVTLASIIAQYGIPFAEFLIAKINTKGEVTPEEWDQLKQLASTTAHSEMIERLQANGIDPASPEGQKFLALVSPPTPVAVPDPTPVPQSEQPPLSGGPQ